jgi:histidine decarboxylase
MTVAHHDDKKPRSPGADDRPSLVPSDFALDRARTDTQRNASLTKLLTRLRSCQTDFLGYQLNQKLKELHKDLGAFLDIHINNLGDPYGDSNLGTHTKLLERAVLAYYAKLWRIQPQPEPDPGDTRRQVDPESAWGYVLSMGSSEGNVYGLLNARDYLSGKSLMMAKDAVSRAVLTDPVLIEGKPHEYEPVIFFSQDTHYSVAKAAHTLLIPTFGETGNKLYPRDCPKLKRPPSDWPNWPMEVPSNDDGTIHIDDLATLVKYFALEKGHPILIVLNLGSTYKGAYDNVVDVLKKLQPTLVTLRRRVQPDPKEQKFDDRDGYWIHIDGALGAAYLPFLRKAQVANRTAEEKESPRPYDHVKNEPVREFDFSLKVGGATPVAISSIVMSGHKFPGSPWPCGIFMTRSKLQLKPPPLPEYIGSPDTTFAGSRNGFSAIVLWNFLARHAEEDQMKMFDECQRIAERIEKGLATIDKNLKATPTADGRGYYDGVMKLDRTPHGLSIVFRKPEQHIVETFSLANVTQADKRGDTEGVVDYSHLFVMPHVDTALADRFITALSKPGAFREKAWRASEWTTRRPDLFQAPHVSQQVVNVATNRGFT